MTYLLALFGRPTRWLPVRHARAIGRPGRRLALPREYPIGKGSNRCSITSHPSLTKGPTGVYFRCSLRIHLMATIGCRHPELQTECGLFSEGYTRRLS